MNTVALIVGWLVLDIAGALVLLIVFCALCVRVERWRDRRWQASR